jgi:hypothetical protein
LLQAFGTFPLSEETDSLLHDLLVPQQMTEHLENVCNRKLQKNSRRTEVISESERKINREGKYLLWLKIGEQEKIYSNRKR